MVYLDHAATTPMLPEALAAYVQAAGDTGNASSSMAAAVWPVAVSKSRERPSRRRSEPAPLR